MYSEKFHSGIKKDIKKLGLPLQNKTDKNRNFMNVKIRHSLWPGVLMVAGGLLLVLSVPIIIILFREELAKQNPRALLTMWYGAGGLALLYLTAGLPLGAILLAAGGSSLYPASESARRVLLPLLGIYLVYFAYHAIRLMIDLHLPFGLFAVTGFIFIALFLTLVGVWARKRPRLKPYRQRIVDLQLGAGLCFFSSAWQSCGLGGAPGFAMYPEIMQKIGNQSFVAGQAFAVKFFIVIGFVFLLLAMLAETPHDKAEDSNNQKP